MVVHTLTPFVAIRGRFALVACAWVTGWLAAVPMAAATEWSATPYRAQCVVLLDGNPELHDAWREMLPVELTQAVHAHFGQVTQLETDVRAGASWRCDDLRLMTTGQVRDWVPVSSSFDKVFVVVVESDARDLTVGCVEWDARTRSFSEVIIDRQVQLPTLHRAIAHSVVRAFRPIGRLVRVERAAATMEMRAGRLGAVLQPGAILQPVNCRLNRLGEITEEGIAVVPWTMLRVVPWPEDRVPAAELVQCAIDSGLRSPFRVRSSRRVERYAIGVRPTLPQTTFRFESSTHPPRPLVGYELHSRQPDQSRYEWVGSSDYLGRIVVARGEHPYQIFYVKQGNMLLARLPFLVGLQSEVTLSLPDYADRLKAEAFARGVEDDLLDAIVKRELAVVAFRRRLSADVITASDLEAARLALREIEALNRPDELFREIQRREAMFRSSDPVVQKRIDLLFHELRQTIRKSMNPQYVAKLQAELAEAQQRSFDREPEEPAPVTRSPGVAP